MTLTLHQITTDGTFELIKIDTENINLLNDRAKKLSSVLSKDSLDKALNDGIIFSLHGTGTEIFMKSSIPIHVVESKYVIEKMLIGN